MARLSLADHLQNFPFQLLDAGVSQASAIPVFTPGMSFSSISSPEIQIELEEIAQANSLFTKKVVKHAEIQPITLMRGATAFDADFYRWIMAALTGRPTFFSRGTVSIGGGSSRRNLILLQFFRHSPLPRAAIAGVTAGLGAAAGAASGALSGGIQDVSGAAIGAALSGLNVGASLGGAAALEAVTGAPYTTAIRLPARAWYLEGCIPTRYKPASDFDATSGDVSVMELEIAVEGMREYSLLSPVG